MAEVQDAAVTHGPDGGGGGGGGGGGQTNMSEAGGAGGCNATMMLLGSLSETCTLPGMRIGAPLCGTCEPIRCDDEIGTASCGLVTGRCVKGWCIER